MIKIKNRFFFILALSMALIVALSNYLIQFPIKYMDLQDLFTYGAFTYPITFLITDLANRAYGKDVARKVVYVGFVIGIVLTFTVSPELNPSLEGLSFSNLTKSWASIITSYKVYCKSTLVYVAIPKTSIADQHS